ncbi:hypothetical protein NPX13_g9012 [Xylaria arbuscula]|uniref:Uncharacterized protein n=1 Tax=Xylaria arbuscula TaxID=114810 RepID=A0A9W8N766_9PEZI|nr:hypothetical protein NPX13_g9012 [Xylaria arbuscula]
MGPLSQDRRADAVAFLAPVLHVDRDSNSAMVMIRAGALFSPMGALIIDIGLLCFLGDTGKGASISWLDAMKKGSSQPRVGLSGRMYGSGWNSKSCGKLENETFFLDFMRDCRAGLVGGSSRKNALVRGDDEAVLLKSGVLDRVDKLGDEGLVTHVGELALSVMLPSMAAIKSSA